MAGSYPLLGGANPDETKSLEANGSITKQRAVKHDSTAGKIVQSTAGDASFGIAIDGASSGEDCRVAFKDGEAAAMEVNGSGTSIAAGDFLESDANGKGIKSAPSSGTNAEVVAIAEEGSSADGDVIGVTIKRIRIQG